MYVYKRSPRINSIKSTVNFALQTGELVLNINSALLGFWMSKNLTVPSWLDVANWFSLCGLHCSPWILDKCAAIYWTGAVPFR